MRRHQLLASLLVTSLCLGAGPGVTLEKSERPGNGSSPTGDCVSFDDDIVVDILDRPRTVVIGDLDGDGDNDIARTVSRSSQDGDLIEWYENLLGDGRNWASHPGEITVEESAELGGASDLDLDGADDLWGVIDSDLVWWKHSPVSGSKVPELIASNGVEPRWELSAKSFHADNDRAPDIVASSPTALLFHRNRMRWDGSWQSSVVDFMVATDDRSVEVGTGDIDGDGRLDVVAGGVVEALGSRAQIAWYRNPYGDVVLGSQPLAWQRTVIDEVRWAWTLGVTDLDGDGDNDLIATSINSANGPILTAWYENLDGDGSQWTKHVVRIEPPVFFILSDLNGDGLTDLLGSEWLEPPGTGSRIFGWENNPSKSILDWEETPFRSGSVFRRAAAVGDLNGDDAPDIAHVVPDRRTGRIEIFFNSACNVTPRRERNGLDRSVRRK